MGDVGIAVLGWNIAEEKIGSMSADVNYDAKISQSSGGFMIRLSL